MEHKKKITDLKKSIEKFNDFSTKEKTSLVDSIEMLWLNAGIQKKKKDIKIDGNNSSDHIKRIRQLLSAAWSEDLKD
ncbi:hypothetical protein OAY92_02890 [Alphaproteobacteria bacterium]|jgi:hypothetical protein|nr:hypothetical protein [Alphaproteobacteria bacterium]|tara:strand:- start:1317 stop:1547 length:231 start_codon:yes stop_codon:yes gene_type:complete